MLKIRFQRHNSFYMKDCTGSIINGPLSLLLVEDEGIKGTIGRGRNELPAFPGDVPGSPRTGAALPVQDVEGLQEGIGDPSTSDVEVHMLTVDEIFLGHSVSPSLLLLPYNPILPGFPGRCTGSAGDLRLQAEEEGIGSQLQSQGRRGLLQESELHHGLQVIVETIVAETMPDDRVTSRSHLHVKTTEPPLAPADGVGGEAGLNASENEINLFLGEVFLDEFQHYFLLLMANNHFYQQSDCPVAIKNHFSSCNFCCTAFSPSASEEM